MPEQSRRWSPTLQKTLYYSLHTAGVRKRSLMYQVHRKLELMCNFKHYAYPRYLNSNCKFRKLYSYGFKAILNFLIFKINNFTGVQNVKELSSFSNAWAGFFAAFFSSLTLCPTELIKCKLQAMREVEQMRIAMGKSTVNSAR